MAKIKKRTQQNSRSFMLPLVVTILILSILAGLFFKDYREVPYGWFITIIWLAATFFSLAFGILYYARFILPHHEGESWLEGVAMILRGGFQSGTPPQPSKKGDAFIGQSELPVCFYSLRAGILKSHQVLSINQGTQFARAAGPGYVRLGTSEIIDQVIDLRKHVRSQDITVNTRDGIPLETKVSVTFQIKQSERDGTGENLVYPYHQNAIFQVAQAGSYDAENELLPWPEQLAPQAASYTVSELAQFTLNELSQDPGILRGVQNRVRRLLRSNFDSMGLKIYSVNATFRKLPQEIMEQRMENWRVPWQSKITAQQAASDAIRMKRMKQARAHVQLEIIQKIMSSIDEMRQREDVALPQIVTLRMIEALDEAISSKALEAHVPGQVLADLTLETTNQMQTLIESESEDSESAEKESDG